jgi:hypothetical protein
MYRPPTPTPRRRYSYSALCPRSCVDYASETNRGVWLLTCTPRHRKPLLLLRLRTVMATPLYTIHPVVLSSKNVRKSPRRRGEQVCPWRCLAGLCAYMKACLGCMRMQQTCVLGVVVTMAHRPYDGEDGMSVCGSVTLSSRRGFLPN